MDNVWLFVTDFFLGIVVYKCTKLAFSKLEVIFCVFLAENNFVNALILFIRVRQDAV
jgi:hypothetical protein